MLYWSGYQALDIIYHMHVLNENSHNLSRLIQAIVTHHLYYLEFPFSLTDGRPSLLSGETVDGQWLLEFTVKPC